MTRPEEVLAFPFFAHDFEDGWTRDHREAIAAACNAYPLALTLAEAAQEIVDQHARHIEAQAVCSCENCALYEALAAFLAHRQEARNA